MNAPSPHLDASAAPGSPRRARDRSAYLRLFGEPALIRAAYGQLVVSPSARRSVNDAALRAGRLLTLDGLADALGWTERAVYAAVNLGDLDVWTSPGDLRTFVEAEEAVRFARAEARPAEARPAAPRPAQALAADRAGA